MEECLIGGAPLKYLQSAEEMECALCHKFMMSEAQRAIVCVLKTIIGIRQTQSQ